MRSTVGMKLTETKNLFITRKRKKWKFAHFSSWENCFSLSRGDDPKLIKSALMAYLPNNKKLVLELAAGNAQFSLELARRHANTNFVAIDLKSDRLYTSAKKALQENVKNIAFLRCQIEPLIKSGDNNRGTLEGIFGKKSIDEIWLTFPDPYPRKRSAKHRLTHSYFLRQYRNLLKPNLSLKFKTDNRELFLWSLEQFVANSWHIHELSFDVHESDLPDDYKIKTYYEQKFTVQNIPINLLSANFN